MPWWVWIYVALLTLGVAAGTVGGVGGKKPAWFVAGEWVSAACLVGLVVGYWVPAIGTHIAPVALLMVAYPLLWEPLSARWVLRHMGWAGDLDDAERRQGGLIGMALGALFLCPAALWGVLLWLRS
jgi:hypothetical protein